MQIGKKELVWNYAATFLRIGSSVLLTPIILKMMPSDMVGIWMVFVTISSFANLLDFGFAPSFTRNITYIFSGVTSFKVRGFQSVSLNNKIIDYDLLKGSISTMRWFYLRIAIILLILLVTLGTYYIYNILQKYNGNHLDVYIAWTIFCIINTYNIYTLYYDSLLQGKGLVKRSKQIVIIGQTIYLIIAIILIINGNGLIAIVSAQAASVIIVRWLSYNTFFTNEINEKLLISRARDRNEILQAIYPNALKIGLATLGGFLVQRSSIIIGSMYLTLAEIASFGITFQLISIITGLAGIHTATYLPKIIQFRIENKNLKVKQYYLKGQLIQIITYVACGLTLLFLGKWALSFLGSQTHLLSSSLLSIALIVSFLESNHSIAGQILLTNNEVPFFKASLISGALTFFLLLIMFNFFSLGLWPMILAPGIAHLYNNWKWPHELYKQLKITKDDVKNSFSW